MIGARFGHFLDRPLAPLLRKLGVSPNAITVAGFCITLLGALLLMFHLRVGATVILAGSVLDMLDGIVARTQGKETKFGAFLDSVLDRVADAAIFLALAWNLGAAGNRAGAFLSLGTLVAAFAVSYAKAKAEALGVKCEAGVMERPERIVLVVIGAVTGWIMPVLWVLFVLTCLTVAQRVYHVRKEMP